MTLDAVIMILGAIVALLPFLQFPPEWTTVLSFIAGLIIIGLGIAVRRRGKRSPAPSRRSARVIPDVQEQEDEPFE